MWCISTGVYCVAEIFCCIFCSEIELRCLFLLWKIAIWFSSCEYVTIESVWDDHYTRAWVSIALCWRQATVSCYFCHINWVYVRKVKTDMLEWRLLSYSSIWKLWCGGISSITVLVECLPICHHIIYMGIETWSSDCWTIRSLLLHIVASQYGLLNVVRDSFYDCCELKCRSMVTWDAELSRVNIE